jgi:hypothetical protein
MLQSFFGVDPHVFRSGLWAKLRPGAKDLYLFLMEESERLCTREITATDEQVRNMVGAASRTLCDARKKLQEHGLIWHKRTQGNKYKYSICNPRTGQPYAEDPRQPLVVPRRSQTLGGRPGCKSPKTGPAADLSMKPARAEEELLDGYGLPMNF